MTSDDTDDTVYTVAFGEGGFLMVWNPKRKGWEMPGGHVKRGETREEGAVREFREESGYDVEIIGMRDLGHCRVCAGILGGRTGPDREMEVRIFSELPDELSFPRDEYEDTVPWAERTVGSSRRPSL